MVKSTQIARLDGLMLAASVDDEQAEAELADQKSKVKAVIRRLNKNSETQASIECGAYTIHYLITNQIAFLCIADASYPRKLAFLYLSDLATEFTSSYQSTAYLAATCRPYAFLDFDSAIQRTKKTYQDSRALESASNNNTATAMTTSSSATGENNTGLERLNTELKDVTKVMTKNIEDLLYRGDNLERMGEMSGRLREDSRKYRKAAVRINWELLLKQYGPIGALDSL